MHLNLLCDASLSDLFDDSGCGARTGAARQHWDGLIRGLVFAGFLILPIALTFAPVAFGAANGAVAQAGTAP